MTVLAKKNAAADMVAAGIRTIEIETDAMRALADGLRSAMADPFAKAVETVLAATGRTIVSGMGKSGHIARKIAATMASTGTPAHFVHPGEASHGDLGMIVPGDVVILISSGGESPELADLIRHTKRFAIPLIAITSKPQSTLGKAGDIVLTLPAMPEACPMGMAPTTSTTLTLALGDALSVALMETRGFTKDDFGVRHPGGKLGKMLLRVSDLMHTGEAVPTIHDGATMAEAIMMISKKRMGCVGVVNDGGILLGMITDGDLRRHMDSHIMDKTVNDVMTKTPKTMTADKLAVEAVALMQDRSITQLFVLDEAGRPVGLIHIHDCLKAGLV
ncbi:MAG: SIS domain-containing protein [Bdellovibrionales bacterium]